MPKKAKKKKKILRNCRTTATTTQGGSLMMMSLTPFYEGENFELAQVLRRLNKKDATTRAKNLDRLQGIFETCKAKDIREALNHWMYELEKLWLDNDRRVRANVFKIMLLLARRVPKAARKRSETFLTPWLCSIFDPCRDVSKLAEQSFQLLYDGKDYMTFLSENMEEKIKWILEDLEKYLKSTKSSLSDLKLVSVHEAEIRLSRVLITSFRALRRVMSVMLHSSSNLTEKTLAVSKLDWNVWSCLGSNGGKKVKYDSAVTKAAHSTFQVILSKGSNITIKWLKEKKERMKRYTELVVGGLFVEKTRENHHVMCNSMLLFLKQCPTCWSCVSIEKILLPRLWSFLRHGCYGSDLYDSMFVFRSMVPKEIEERDEFLTNWFESFWEGLPENVNTSRFESALLTLCQCIQLSLKSSSITITSGKELCKQLNRVILNCVKCRVMSCEKKKKKLGEILAKTCAFFISHINDNVTLSFLETIFIGDDTIDADDLHERSILFSMIRKHNDDDVKAASLSERVVKLFTSKATCKLKQHEIQFVKTIDVILEHFNDYIVLSLTSYDVLCLLQQELSNAEKSLQEEILESLLKVFLRIVNTPLSSRLETRLTCFYSKYNTTKLHEVNMLIEKYFDQEDKLFEKLIKKYGPERSRLDMCDALYDVVMNMKQRDRLPVVVSILCRVVVDSTSLRDEMWLERMENFATLLYDIGTEESARGLKDSMNLVSSKFRDMLKEKFVNDLRAISLRSMDQRRNDADADRALRVIRTSRAFLFDKYDDQILLCLYLLSTCDNNDDDNDDDSVDEWSLVSSCAYDTYANESISNDLRRNITIHGAQWLASVLHSTTEIEPVYELWALRCLSIRDLVKDEEVKSWWNKTSLSSETVWIDAKKNKNKLLWKRLLLSLSALLEFTNLELTLSELPCWIVYEILYACAWEYVLRTHLSLSSEAKRTYDSVGSALRSISFVLYDRIFPILSEAASNRIDMKINASYVSRLLNNHILNSSNRILKSNDVVLDIFVAGLFGIDVASSIRDSPRHGLFTQRRALLTKLEEEEKEEEKEEHEEKPEEKKEDTKICQFKEGDVALYTNEARGFLNAEVKIVKVHNDAGGQTYFEIRLPDGKIIGTIAQKLQSISLSEDSRVVDYEATLIQFYSKHVPEKTSDVKRLLRKYRSVEHDLVEALVKKYGRPVPLVFFKEEKEYEKKKKKKKVEKEAKKEEVKKNKERRKAEQRLQRRKMRRKRRRRKLEEQREKEHALGSEESRSILKNVLGQNNERICHALKSVLKDPKEFQVLSTMLIHIKEEEKEKKEEDEKTHQMIWNEFVNIITNTTKKDRTIEQSVEYSKHLEKLLIFAINHISAEKIVSLTYGPHSSLVFNLLKFSIPTIQHLAYKFVLRAMLSGLNLDEKIEDIRAEMIVPKGLFEMLSQEKIETPNMWYAYMLSWNLLVSVFGKASISSQIKCILASHVSKSRYVERVLELCVSSMIGNNKTWLPSRFPRFTSSHEMNQDFDRLPYPYDFEAANSLHRSTMMHTAARVPALFRAWWNARDFSSKRERVMIENFVSSKVSPCCVNSEMLNLAIGAKSKRWNTDQMSIRGSRVSRTICASYHTEEWSLEISVELPPRYPLLVPRIECSRRFGIEEDRMRRWIVQIRSVISSQNASLLDAILLWKENVDLEFNGMDPCPICYSVVHVTRHTLPRLVCSTCSKKFHSDCLYKWFTTSQKSACPLCRQPF